jgi:hypothetical protein
MLDLPAVELNGEGSYFFTADQLERLPE